MLLVDLHEVYLAHKSYLHYNLFFLQSSTFHNIKIKIRYIIRLHQRKTDIPLLHP